MSAASFGNLLGGVMAVATAQEKPRAGVWRGSFDINDERSQVGRRLGDGSYGQGMSVIAAIRETAFEWIKDLKKEKGRENKLRWDVINTLCAVLGFTNFKTGECTPTYEQIAAAAGCCRLTAIRHCAILRENKLLDWVRRSRGGDGNRNEQAPSSYMFELSRLPTKFQIHMRQILKRMGIKLECHPDRKGSGPVPNKGQRLAERVLKGFAAATGRLTQKRRREDLEADAAFVRSEMALFGDIPTDQWATIRHPDDIDAQRAYSERMGIPFFGFQGNNNAPDLGLTEL
ncbi:hypothetical protein [Novosphingobium sp.]|uniref:hypothetical protein n=1 Tax=Novosphingobium sp. TaxID=1874826 RepID=UPI0031D6A30F